MKLFKKLAILISLSSVSLLAFNFNNNACAAVKADYELIYKQKHHSLKPKVSNPQTNQDNMDKVIDVVIKDVYKGTEYELDESESFQRGEVKGINDKFVNECSIREIYNEMYKKLVDESKFFMEEAKAYPTKIELDGTKLHNPYYTISNHYREIADDLRYKRMSRLINESLVYMEKKIKYLELMVNNPKSKSYYLWENIYKECLKNEQLYTNLTVELLRK